MTTRNPMIPALPVLVRDLALDDQNGTPVLVCVKDYKKREELAAALSDEAEVYRIRCDVLSEPGEALGRLSAMQAADGQAAIVLINAGQAQAWGRVLESCREKLPEWVRFLIVLLFEEDLPALAQEARAFFSWAKGRFYEDLATSSEPSEDIALEMDRMRAETGLGPEQFIAEWRAGKIQDTYQNSVWLNMAHAIVGKDKR